jgi:hypothetical protein
MADFMGAENGGNAGDPEALFCHGAPMGPRYRGKATDQEDAG